MDIEENFLYYYIISRAISSAERAITLPRSETGAPGTLLPIPRVTLHRTGQPKEKAAQENPCIHGDSMNSQALWQL